MRYDRISVTRSLETGRVIRHTSPFDLVSDFLFYVYLVAALPIGSGLILGLQIEYGGSLVGPIMLLSASLVYCGLVLYSMSRLDRLRRATGVRKDRNRQVIKELTEELGWKLHSHNQDLSVLVPPWKWYSTNWGRQLVVIYDNRDILVNASAYGLHDLKSPYHWSGNRKLERLLIDRFEARISE